MAMRAVGDATTPLYNYMLKRFNVKTDRKRYVEMAFSTTKKSSRFAACRRLGPERLETKLVIIDICAQKLSKSYEFY